MQPNPFPLLRFFNPSVLRTPPLYFAVQNTEEEGESNPPLIAVRYSSYGARQGRSLEVALYSFAMNKRSGLYFSNSPPSPCGHSPYIPCRNTPQCCGTRQGERRVNSITSIAGFLSPLLVAVLRTPPLYFAVQNTEEEYTLYRNLNKNQLFTEKSELCLSTKDSSLKSISIPRIFC